MVNFTILAGGFSTFIATYIFDSNANSLTLSKQTTTGDNPSWIASHLQNSSILYAVNEIQPVGNLQSFIVGSDGGLTLVDTVSTGGNGPTFTNPLSTGEVTGMNFGSPDSALVATVPGDPLHFQKNSPVVQFPVNGGPSNPHMSLEFNGEVFVSDLGADKIWRLVRDGAPGNFKVQGQINVAPGNGPRHMAIRDNILFTINEKTSTLTAQQIPQAPNGTTLPLIANVSIIPTDIKLNATFAAAELIVTEPTEQFPDSLIYVSNRNLGPEFDPRGDSIAIFQFSNDSSTSSGDCSKHKRMVKVHARQLPAHQARQTQGAVSGNLTLINQVFTNLTQIRSMAIGPVSIAGAEEFLIAGANVAGGVVMYQRTNGGRNLTELVRNTDVQNRTSFVFI